jgi:hypothetical protein
MKQITKIAVVICLLMLPLLSCREELFELVGDHDIEVIYSNNPSFTNSPPSDWVKDLKGEAEFGLCAATTDFYFRITNVSSKEVVYGRVPPCLSSLLRVSSSLILHLQTLLLVLLQVDLWILLSFLHHLAGRLRVVS